MILNRLRNKSVRKALMRSFTDFKNAEGDILGKHRDQALEMFVHEEDRKALMKILRRMQKRADPVYNFTN